MSLKKEPVIRCPSMAHKFPEDLLALVAHLKKLPGVGSRTAERFAFEFLPWAPDTLKILGNTLIDLHEKVPPCPRCGCLADPHSCKFCHNRNTTSLCVLASARDAYAIEETGNYRGLYHVVEHLLSPLDGRHASTFRLDRIEQRRQEHKISELIIAFDSTLEGDATALYLKNHLARPHLAISRLAFGLPVGSSLEYIDGSTLARAFSGRQIL